MKGYGHSSLSNHRRASSDRMPTGHQPMPDQYSQPTPGNVPPRTVRESKVIEQEMSTKNQIPGRRNQGD